MGSQNGDFEVQMPSWHWFLPTSGDGRRVTNVVATAGQQAVSREADVGYLSEVAMAAERAGFDAVLTPTGSACEDAWITCAAVSQHTERLRFIVAFRPDTISPAWAAHQAASFQRLTGGRLLLNIVSGGDPAEQRSLGDQLDKAGRYRRTDEFLTVVKACWRGEPFDHEGEFFEVEGAGLRRPLGAVGQPPVYFGGSSPAALDVAAKHADVYLTWGEPVEAVGAKVEEVRARGREYGRQLRCGLRIHVIARESEEEAWVEAQRMLDDFGPEAIRSARERYARMDSTGQAKMTELTGSGNAEDLVVAPNLWAGIGLVREGAGTAIVGSHEQVAERLLEYRQAGISEYILSGYPHLEEALRFGEEVRPLIDEMVAAPA